MRRTLPALLSLVFATTCAGHAAERLIPAGSLVQCTVSEPKLSSKTADVGDPVLCQVGRMEKYGRSVLPYGSYLEGRFEDYKDPGHFVGKGWMVLKFDRMIVPPDTVIPMDAKVVDVPGYPVDKQGKIHGKGHAVRDAIEWSIPILWPIDLLNLPRRGPRPVLKEETRLTLKIMDDFGVPATPEAPRDPYGFTPRAPVSYGPPDVAPPPAERPILYPRYAPIVAPIAVVEPVPLAQAPLTYLAMRDGSGGFAREYWFTAGTIGYITANGDRMRAPIEALDFDKTVDVNRRHGVSFTVRSPAGE